MAKVIIRETDLTAVSNSLQTTDVAYVPGFGSKEDAATNIKAGVPTLVQTVAQFKNLFGDVAPTASTALAYSDGKWDTAGKPTSGSIIAEGEVDPGYVYAMELLNLGMPVYYELIEDMDGETFDPSNVYTVFATMFDKLRDRGSYQVKYITTGGWPVWDYIETVESTTTRPLVSTLLNVAGSIYATTEDAEGGRGDCIVLIDHTNKPDRPLDPTNTNSVYYSVNANEQLFAAFGSFAQMVTPWGEYALSSRVNYKDSQGKTRAVATKQLPGSFAYLQQMAKYVSKYEMNHISVAGPIRGCLTNYKPCIDTILSNSIADAYQFDCERIPTASDKKISINGITMIHPYGYTIWGNRTLAPASTTEGVKATQFVNIRNMVSDIKKVTYMAARKYMFEQNTDILWINFKNEIVPTLDKFKYNQGITAYTITKVAQYRTKLEAQITIKPIYAVESFDINIVITDDNIETSED